MPAAPVHASVYVGVALLEVSVCLIALGANIQRYALSRIPPGLYANLVWLGGLTVYFSANVIYTIALVFAPASLCATLVATIILANAITSRLLLKERLELVERRVDERHAQRVDHVEEGEERLHVGGEVDLVDVGDLRRDHVEADDAAETNRDTSSDIVCGA